MKKWYAFLYLVLLMSCGIEAEQIDPQATSFFDLKSYFAEELKTLSGARQIEKSTLINGVRESHTFDSLDFAQELTVFINSDINRPAWLDQYAVDSTLTANGQLSALTYKALKPELKTQQLHVEFEQGHPNLIQIKNATKNALMDASMDLEYHSGKNYRIQSNQKLKLSEEREMIVEVIL